MIALPISIAAAIFTMSRSQPLRASQPSTAIDGSFYFIAGVGVNYQQSGDIIQAPIRTGVGLRAGINIGYNLRLILKWLRKLLRKIITAIRTAIIPFSTLIPKVLIIDP